MRYILTEDTVCGMSIKCSETACLCTSHSFSKGEVFEYVGEDKAYPLVLRVCLLKDRDLEEFRKHNEKMYNVLKNHKEDFGITIGDWESYYKKKLNGVAEPRITFQICKDKLKEIKDDNE